MHDSVNDTNLKISTDPNTKFFDLMTRQDRNVKLLENLLEKTVQKHKLKKILIGIALQSICKSNINFSMYINNSAWHECVCMLA